MHAIAPKPLLLLNNPENLGKYFLDSQIKIDIMHFYSVTFINIFAMFLLSFNIIYLRCLSQTKTLINCSK